MIFVLIGVVAVGLGILATIDDGDPWFLIVIPGVLFIGLFAVMLPLNLIFNHTFPQHDVTVQRVATLQDEVGTQGQINGGGFLFFSFSGSFDQRLSISYYTQDGNSFSPHTISEADGNIVIHQEPRGSVPRIVTDSSHEVQTTPGWVAPFNIDWSAPHTYHTTYTVYAPQGTIRQGKYKLDAKN